MAVFAYNIVSMKELLQKLIRCAPTAENGELQISQVLKSYFADAGIDAQIDCWDGKHANLTAVVKGSGEIPGLLFGGHSDVVPVGQEAWTYPPFEAVEADGKIHGRGAVDMLSGLAASAAAVAAIKKKGIRLKGDCIFSATAAEETDSCGIKKFLRSTAKTLGALSGIIVPEPTAMQPIRAHRGILWLSIETAGKTAHGSMPHLGINAIDKMRRFLNALQDYRIAYPAHPLLGQCCLSVNTIAGGQAANIVPDSCTIRMDIRTLPGQEHTAIMQDMERLFEQIRRQDKDFAATLSVVRSVPALETAADDPFVRSVCRIMNIDQAGAVGFTTDGPWFATLGVPVMLLGPGQPAMCHKPNEYIEIESLRQAEEVYRNIILGVLG